jgi:pimeloyl-ACP methyl ester carboxylesterase
VIARLDALKFERTHFCGWAIGGLTGRWLGLHGEGRLDRIVVCATAARIATAESWNARIDEVRASGLGVCSVIPQYPFLSRSRQIIPHLMEIGCAADRYLEVEPDHFPLRIRYCAIQERRAVPTEVKGQCHRRVSGSCSCSCWQSIT